jgi:hypothetical protein
MFKIEKVIEIGIKDLHEWQDNPIKRQAIPDKELKKTLEEDGLLVDTIAVVPNGKGYIVVDGNRRLRIAKELGLEGGFLAKVYPKNVDKVALAIRLNGVGTPWDRQSYVQFVIGHPERIEELPERYRKDTKKMYELLGKDYEWFAMNCKPNAYNWGYELVKYLGMVGDEKFLKKVVVWVGKHKLVREVRKAIDSRAPRKMILNCIEKDNPLKITVTAA